MKIETIFLIHLFATFCMTGVIWVVQCAHYPAFEYIAPERKKDFAYFHQRNISFVVLPLMTGELATGFYLYLRMMETPRIWKMNLLLIVLTWISTFLIQVPIHQKMLQGFDQSLVRKLVCTNWIRTFLWTLRSCILLICLANFGIS